MVTKIKVALFDTDGYMYSLAAYLCKKCGQIIETRLFTDLEKFEHYICQGTIDVLMAPEDWKQTFREYEAQIPQLIFLGEEKNLAESSEFPLIFKYQAMPEIVKEMFALVAENDKISYRSKMISKRAVEMICGYAPFGGGGVTEFLLRTAAEKAKRENVLYVNLEEFQGLSYIREEKQRNPEVSYGGMSEILFYLRQRREKLALKLASVIWKKDGVDYIFSVEDYRDLHAMTEKDMADFLQILIEQTEYESLIFDIGFLSSASLLLMEECQKIFMPKPSTPVQLSKECAFRKNLTASGQEEILRKREWIIRE